MDKKPNASFSYTYTAAEKKEVNSIRKKYLPHEETKLERLRRLDESVTRKGTVVALIIGIVGALIAGFGMSLIMTDIAASLDSTLSMVLGIILGFVGIGIALTAYPTYGFITKRTRERLAPEILRLADELLQK